MELPKAIIFGSYVNALSLIRALGRKGVPVIAVDHLRGISGYSKYVKEFALAPDPYEDEDGFYDFLLNQTSRWGGAVLLPTDDFQLDVFSKHRQELSKHYIVTVANRNAVETVINKRLAHELALKLNIPAPRTFFPTGPEHVAELAASINYPCILKPVEGHRFKKYYGVKVFQVNSAAELRSEYEKVPARYPLMIQEIVEGNDTNIILYAAYYDSTGEPLAEFTGQKIRQNPPLYGNARVAKSIHNSEIMAFSRAMLKELNYGGSLVGTEFKYDDRDGKLKFMEINARSVMWYSLIEASGMNLPWIMYQDIALDKKTRQKSHKTNVFWIHETTDMPAIIRRPKHEKSTTRDYLAPYFSKRSFAIFARDDWMPAIMGWRPALLYFLKLPVRLCRFFVSRTRRRM
jgi:D-aspartate ligase